MVRFAADGTTTIMVDHLATGSVGTGAHTENGGAYEI